MWLPPRPPQPATPMRTVSLAPMTLPDALVPAMVKSGKAALAAAASFRNLRRDRWDMRVLLASDGKGGSDNARITAQPLGNVQQVKVVIDAFERFLAPIGWLN